MIKEINVKHTEDKILIYEDGTIKLPHSYIDFDMAIDYISAIQKAIEFLRESGVNK